MNYTGGSVHDHFKKEIEECFGRSGLPSEENLQKALGICMLSACQGPLYRSLDTALDTLSERVNTAQFWPAVSFTFDDTQQGLSFPERKPDRWGTLSIKRSDLDTPEYAKWSDEFKDLVANAGTSDLDHGSYTRGYQIRNHLIGNACNALNEWHTIQLNNLFAKVNEKGYIKKRDLFELADEITRRQLQFPGDRIYTFIGRELGEYFDGVYSNKQLAWRNSFVINHEGYYDSPFDGYSSFVLAKSQVVTSQKNEATYSYTRESRRWRYHLGVVHKFKLEVADYPGTTRRMVQNVQNSKLF